MRVYIAEIQGLRTLAALLVAVYHIWFNKVSGGVDVFFVVSAYFIAQTLTNFGATNSRQLLRYYEKTFRRILPSSLIVFVGTIGIVFIFVPFVFYKHELKNSIATFFFLENWFLSLSGADYLTDSGVKSLYQQFWALSVQVQFYLLFPALYLVISKVFKRVNFHSKVNFVFTLFFAFSIVYGFYSSKVNPSWAYFDSFGRGWEFAAGLLLYNNRERIRLAARLATFLNIIAIIGVILFGFAVSKGVAMPSAVSLVPVICACIIILTSQNTLIFSPLKLNILAKFGDYSFNFYLWHWPIFIVIFNYYEITGNMHIDGGLVLVISAILAFITTKYVENPIKKSKFLLNSHKYTALMFIIIFFINGLALSSFAASYFSKVKVESEKVHDFYVNGYSVEKNTPYFPHPIVIKEDIPASYNNGCHQKSAPSLVVICQYGENTSPVTIALIGGSHATQWLPPLRKVLGSLDVNFFVITKSSCSLVSYADVTYSPSASCIRWNYGVLDKLKAIKPNYIITTVTRDGPSGEYVPEGYVSAWENIYVLLPEVKLVGIRDNPWFDFDPPYCLEMFGIESHECTIQRDDFYRDGAVAALAPHVSYLIDFSNDFCPHENCTTVNGEGLAKYRDRHHLSRAYTMTFIDKLETHLSAVIN